MSERDLKIAIDRYGPKCPHCQEDGFDDWWHARTIRQRGSLLTGSLKCHGCGKFFSVSQYSDGETHSSAWSRLHPSRIGTARAAT